MHQVPLSNHLSLSPVSNTQLGQMFLLRLLVSLQQLSWHAPFLSPSLGSFSCLVSRALPHSLSILRPFQKGGLSDSDSVKYLNAVNAIVNRPPVDSPLCFSRLPPLSFSFGRGLQGVAMQKWVRGDEAGAKLAFEERAKACFLAATGKYAVL